MLNQAGPTRVDLVLGARPQFVKAAPFFRVRNDFPELDLRVVHTGQHFEPNMSDLFFRDLRLPAPDENLGISGGGHSEMTGRMMAALEQYFLRSKTSYVLVFGDTNSTLAAALAASKIGVPIGHVEAGLRSGDRTMPEEINRIVVDHLALDNFAPTERSMRALAREGLSGSSHLVGDVMFDVFCWLKGNGHLIPNLVSLMGLQDERYAIASIHRQKSTESSAELERRLDFISAHAGTDPVLLLMHPRLRQKLNEFDLDVGRFTLVDPVGYLEMASLLSRCRVIFTDSGGLQKEAYFHQKRCITLRDETEWPETIGPGMNSLWTADNLDSGTTPSSSFGNGAAAQQVLAIVCSRFSDR